MSRGGMLLPSIPGTMLGAAAGRTPKGYSYAYFVTVESTSVGVCSLELPFFSGAHLLGIPKLLSGAGKLDVATAGMEQVTLEGNFNEVFELYAAPDEQSDARYVLDPAAMVFVADFCRQYYWEIVDDSLYFVTTGVPPDALLVDEFVKQIRPAVEVASDRVHTPAKLPYKNTEGHEMHCPKCSGLLRLGRAWMECPDGHGFLITGSQMRDERSSREPIVYAESVSAAHNLVSEAATGSEADTTLECPYCHSPMQHAEYQESEIVIDICTKCPYRWLDAPEIEPILG